jgi:hypothetical protein
MMQQFNKSNGDSTKAYGVHAATKWQPLPVIAGLLDECAKSAA